MKKNLLGLMALCSLATMSFGQISQGGLPLKLNDNSGTYIPTSKYALPDWAAAQKKHLEDAKGGLSTGALIGKASETAFSFPSSGSFIEENGKKIWRGVINIDGAPALMLYFNKFALPKGVNLYVTNKNKKQVLGAYTAENNDPTQLFVIEPVQGGQANIEIDINQGVNLDDIKINIDKALVLFTSIDNLVDFSTDSLSTIDGTDLNDGAYNNTYTGTSSVCNIDAICPLANHYEIQRNATLQILQLNSDGTGGLCSGVLINNTGNSLTSCKQYVLYASHCDGGQDTTATHFAQTFFRFNYQKTTCGGSSIPSGSQVKSFVGGNFKARSILSLTAAGAIDAQAIKGDFLLLEMKSTVPTSVGANMIGWNNTSTPQTSGYTYPKKFVDFNHPGGDVKKVTSFQSITSTGIVIAGSHWGAVADSGLIAEGSSGSSLLDGNGKTLGIASVAYGSIPSACVLNSYDTNISATTFTNIAFSKLSYDWTYQLDATANWNQLKPWLDPTNSGVSTIAPVTSACVAITDTTGQNSGSGSTGIYNTPNELGNSFQVFPNPSNTGKATLSLNLKDRTNINVQLLDITGKKLTSFAINKIQSGNFEIDLSRYANGVYFVQVADGATISTKKLVIAK